MHDVLLSTPAGLVNELTHEISTDGLIDRLSDVFAWEQDETK